MSLHRNNFDFIRFAAATLVWFGHCYELYDYPSVIRYLHVHAFGVHVFFVISGYFITQSYAKHNKLSVFARNRFLRIYPGLAVALLWGALIAGPILTTLSLHDYFFNIEVWRSLFSCLFFTPLTFDHEFLIRVILLPITNLTLPGVFSEHAQQIFNGSIWTIPIEIRCYLLIALLGALRCLKTHTIVIALIVLCFFSTLITALPNSPISWTIWDYIYFSFGSLMYLGRKYFPFDKKMFCLVVVLIGASFWMPEQPGTLFFAFSVSYLVIGFGVLNTPFLQNFAKYGDFSYGMYLWAWPMQQISITLLGAHESFAGFMVLSFILSLFCAVLSWHCIEKPALALKKLP